MMKKILDQLELNVQWLALGLGIVFVSYMAYAYLLDPPVKTEVATKTVSPGEVDDVIWDTVGNKLGQAVESKAVPKVEAPNLTGLFTNAINYNQKPVPTDMLAMSFPANRDLPRDKPPENTPDPNKPDKNLPKGGPQITALPTLPAMTINGFRSGMSNVMPPASAAAAQPAAATDATWVTVRGEVDIAAIQQAFAASKIPDNARKTSFILLAMEREEKLADGTWGERTLVPHIKTSDVQPIPASTAPPGDLWSYLQWAEQHTVDLMQPPFYTIAKGDPWAVPGEQVAAIANAPAATTFDAAQWITAKQADIDAQHFTNEQKQLIFKARQDAAKATSKGRAQPRSSGPGPGRGGEEGGPPGAMNRAPNDTGRPPPFYRPPQAGNPAPGAMRGPPIAGEEFDPEQLRIGPGPAQQASANFPLPVGAFDPAEWLKAHQASSTITVWAHDETAQPGHTYHYRLSYTIKNPIFFAVNVAKDIRLTKVFAIPSPPTAWTDDIEFISTVNFWVVRPPRSSGLVDVQVFRWQAGETKSKQFSVSPGDMIGQKEGDIDFVTGWTVVDVQYDPRTQDYYMLVMDPSGLIHHRDFKTDSADPKLKSWRDQATVASAAGAAAAPGAIAR